MQAIANVFSRFFSGSHYIEQETLREIPSLVEYPDGRKAFFWIQTNEWQPQVFSYEETPVSLRTFLLRKELWQGIPEKIANNRSLWSTERHFSLLRQNYVLGKSSKILSPELPVLYKDTFPDKEKRRIRWYSTHPFLYLTALSLDLHMMLQNRIKRAQYRFLATNILEECVLDIKHQEYQIDKKCRRLRSAPEIAFILLVIRALRTNEVLIPTYAYLLVAEYQEQIAELYQRMHLFAKAYWYFCKSVYSLKKANQFSNYLLRRQLFNRLSQEIAVFSVDLQKAMEPFDKAYQVIQARRLLVLFSRLLKEDVRQIPMELASIISSYYFFNDSLIRGCGTC